VGLSVGAEGVGVGVGVGAFDGGDETFGLIKLKIEKNIFFIFP
jgi:hypothetical protein